ncbi:MAG: SPOR domain-containing protein [Allosphingosinicella sp.]|uniref:SPOR domain-containing protein n=1 Tax=Allosphingosinicella sp. TaxID=2823234 RepID=UPI003928E538
MNRSVRRYGLVAAALATCLSAGAALSQAGFDPSVRQGVEAWQAGNYEQAVRHWRPLADRGDADAQFNMGQAYRMGRGVPADPALARNWFERAARQGHEQAEGILGMMLFQGGQRQQAMSWIRRAADRGDPQAQYILGTAHFNGDLVERDWPRAYALMTSASAQGFPPAADSLRQMETHLSPEDRQRGATLARALPRAGAQTAAATPPAPPAPAATPSRTPRVPAAQPPIARTELPPSAPAATPTPTPAAPAPAQAAPATRAPAPAAGRWRIQLGAFGSEANARRQWENVSRRVGALSGLQPRYERAGALTRLQAGPISDRAAADRLCAAVRAAGEACLTVAP